MNFSIFIVIFIAFATTALALGGTTSGSILERVNVSANEKHLSNTAVLGQDQTALARKRAKGEFVTANTAMSADQSRLRPGGCTRPFPFPPKKPKGSTTKLAYYDTEQTQSVARVYGADDAQRKGGTIATKPRLPPSLPCRWHRYRCMGH